MWRPEAYRTVEEERRLPPLDSVLLVTEKPATKDVHPVRNAATRP